LKYVIDKSTKTKFRRRYKSRKRQVEGIGNQAEENIEKLFFRRLPRLGDVRRFVFAWLLLFLLLIGGVVAQTRSLERLYQEAGPIPGGTFTEGVLGSFTNANPLYATGSVDSAVSHLVFSGLLRYDSQNRLVQDLAERYEINTIGSIYTVTLRDDIFWHDGRAITSADVLFTYKTIQNPDAKSPLLASWQGITIEAPDARTVIFTLPNALTAFPHSLTNGIVPKHLLDGVEPSQLRSVRFNTASPIGSGPFRWGTIEVTGTGPEDRQEQIGFIPYELFHRGQPKLQQFIIRTFRDENKLINSLKSQEINAAVGIETQPDDIEESTLQDFNIPLTSEVMAFFKNSNEILSDLRVRKALVQAVDQNSIVTSLGYPVIPAKSPLLLSHLGNDKNIVQLPFDKDAANKLLDEAGWVRGQDGLRTKDGKPLTLRLFSQTTSEYTYVSRELQKQWAEAGVDVQVMLQSAQDLQQVTISQHNYDILLYGISLGKDPDVFAYWHSSQATPRTGGSLNFSEYRSPVADKSLEAGRTRSDEALRAIKYKPFLEAWRSDAPALALYQPRMLYLTRTPIANFEPRSFNTAYDRYNNVENWMIRVGKTIKE
jgi:peptide/nickel transport system substrate-binding protein